jgi:hypothetical protein
MASVQMACHRNGNVCCCTQGRFAANNLFYIVDKAWDSVTAKIYRRHYQNRICVCNPLAFNPYLLTK